MARHENRPRMEWLRRYASTNPIYQWQRLEQNTTILFHRPLGLVETLFDNDGRTFEGRSDINGLFTLEIRTSLKSSELRERILCVWSNLRLEHPMLRAKVLHASEFLPDDSQAHPGHHFVVNQPPDSKSARKEATETIEFLADYYDSVNADDFYNHTQNTARIVNPKTSLSRLFVFPIESISKSEGRFTLRLLLTAGHQIMDGMTLANWMSHLITLLNSPLESLNISELFGQQSVKQNFPLAQETLYPPIPGSRARQRWFWAITIVLRHVARPLPDAFRNPLRREKPLPSGTALPLEPKYSAVLNYDKRPPFSTFGGLVRVPPRPTRRLHRLCRDAGVSIGAGSFALAGLVSMELEEERFPNVPLDKRMPFISSFPLDPRAMFDSKTKPESLMLAFSYGFVLPFLPSSLPVEGRFKLLAKHAQKGLRVYQKRAEQSQINPAGKASLRILADTYVMCLQRANMARPGDMLPGEGDPEGKYPSISNVGRATHGVSSVGSPKGLLRAGAFPIDATTNHDIVADFRASRQGVRARETEFLVGVGGNDDYLWAVTNADGNNLDERLLGAWKHKMETVLDIGDEARL